MRTARAAMMRPIDEALSASIGRQTSAVKIGSYHRAAHEATGVRRARDFNSVPVPRRRREATRMLAHELRHAPKPAPMLCTKQELPPALLQRSTLFCDIESQSGRIGEFRQIALEQRITELGSVLRGTGADCSFRDEITVFDSFGFALRDLASVRAVLHGVQTNYETKMETP
jgi:hypothetical protein